MTRQLKYIPPFPPPPTFFCPVSLILRITMREQEEGKKKNLPPLTSPSVTSDIRTERGRNDSAFYKKSTMFAHRPSLCRHTCTGHECSGDYHSRDCLTSLAIPVPPPSTVCLALAVCHCTDSQSRRSGRRRKEDSSDGKRREAKNIYSAQREGGRKSAEEKGAGNHGLPQNPRKTSRGGGEKKSSSRVLVSTTTVLDDREN